MATTVVTGLRSSALTMSGTDTLNITAAGNFTGTANPEVTVNATTGAGISIDNYGTLATTGTGARAIRFTNAAASFTLTNEAGATITAQNDAINVQQNVTSGTLLVNNYGKISSTGVNANNGQAIDFNNVAGTGTSVSITNYTTGVLRAVDSDALRPGNAATVYNYGLIDGQNYQTNSGADGVDFQTNASGTVYNYAGATITGGRHGINHSQITGNTTAAVTLYNWGTVEGRNGSGFGSDNAGIVENHGTITGRADTIAGVANGDGDGVDIDYLGTVRNWGTIQGAGAKGVGSDGLTNTSQGIALGGGTVENHAGAQVLSAGDGILVDNSSAGDAFGATSITNDGLIKGDAGHGIHLVGGWADTLTNAGTIQGGDGTAVDMGGGDDTVVLKGGQIIGLLDGGIGTDTLDLSAETHAMSVDLGAGTIAGTAWLTSFTHVEAVLTSSGNDTLTGAGSSTLQGGAGDDVYHVSGTGDTVVEAAGGGHDTVIATIVHTLEANVEDLVLAGSATAGTGNVGANAITGNGLGDQLSGLAGNDTLTGGAGDDTLDGGTGADSMAGGAGDDTYVVDNAGDLVVELPGGGIDTVKAAINYVLGATLENLELTGSAKIGVGNALNNQMTADNQGDMLRGLDGNDTLTGGTGNDALNGGTGADSMAGGTGDDIYVVDNAGDVVSENAGEGSDLVESFIDYTLGADLEKLFLMGSANLSGTGNALANLMRGNTGDNLLQGGGGNDAINGMESNDTLVGGAGADTLTGGAGNDLFLFNGAAEGRDLIMDFTSGQDHIGLSAAGFGIGAVVLNQNAVQGTAAQLVYVQATGTLIWDADGTGTGAAVTLAMLAGKPVLATSDVILV